MAELSESRGLAEPKVRGIPFNLRRGGLPDEAATKRGVYSASLIFAGIAVHDAFSAVELQQPAAVTTDTPDVVDLSYATPDTWFAIPPIIEFDLRSPLPPLPPAEVDFLPSTKLAALGSRRPTHPRAWQDN